MQEKEIFIDDTNDDAIVELFPKVDLWEKLPYESDLWYDRFHAYLLMGGSRSIPALMASMGANTTSAAAWYTAARDYRWKERARAWDKVQLERERKAVEEARIESRKKRIAVLDKILDKVDKASGIDLDADMLTWSSVGSVLKTVVTELRNEYEPTKEVDNFGVEVHMHSDAQSVLKAKILAIREKTVAQGESPNDSDT